MDAVKRPCRNQNRTKMARRGHSLSLLGRDEAVGVVVFRLMRRCYCVLSQRPSRYPKPCPMVPSPPDAPRFTPKQGQYLAFIYAYTRVLGRPPAEVDLQRHFGVSSPSVHQMILTLERAGLIRRQPGVARSIEVLIPPQELPVLR